MSCPSLSRHPKRAAKDRLRVTLKETSSLPKNVAWKCESRGEQGHPEDVSRDGYLCPETSMCHHE